MSLLGGRETHQTLKRTHLESSKKTQKAGPAPPRARARRLTHLEVDVDVVPEHVHTEELAPADLTGVLLVAMGQQVLVHVAPAGEHLKAGERRGDICYHACRAALRAHNRAQKCGSFLPKYKLPQILSVREK